ncbi:MAG: PAS domain-containing protein [Candidatus Krumholzibacteriota bacterium]|nr:PAS domain-containing protein [Candidatus Krumholzibacteriota bacterium]
MTEEKEQIRRLREELDRERKERAAAEASLKKSRDVARGQFMNIPVPVFVWKKAGDDLVLVDYNKEGNKISGGNVERLIGIKASEFHKDNNAVFEVMRRCARERGIFDREVKIRGQFLKKEWDMDITFIFCEPDLVMAFTFDVTQRKQAEKELSQYRTQLEDLVNKRTLQLEMMNMELKKEMSERREAVEALRESEERYRFVAGLTSDFTFGGSIYPDRKMIIKWSKGSFEDIAGVGIDQGSDGSALFDAIHPDDMEKMLRHIDAYFLNVESVEELRIISRDNKEKWLQIYGKPLGDDGRGGVEFISAAKNITRRKQAEVELENRNRELRVLNRIHKIFEDPLGLEIIMEKVIDILLEESGLNKGGVYFPAEGSAFIECRILRGIDARTADPVCRMPMKDEMVSAIMETEDLFIPEDEFPVDDPEIIEFRKKAGISKTLSIPIFAGNTFKANIVLCLGGEQVIAGEIRDFFKTIQMQLEIELERQDLLSAQQKYETDLKKLAGQLIRSIEEERSHIALNLHDEIGQSMIVIEGEFSLLEKKIEADDTETLDRVKRIREQIHGLTETVRQVSYSLHPAMLEDLGLIPTIQWYIDNFVRNTGIKIAFETAGWDERIDQQLSLTLYRIIQESLTNVVRHSRAKNVLLKLTKGYPDVIMSVVDDGKGFELDSDEGLKGLGIVGMRERVNSQNGRFIIHSTPGEGTRIRVTLPLEGSR